MAPTYPLTYHLSSTHLPTHNPFVYSLTHFVHPPNLLTPSPIHSPPKYLPVHLPIIYPSTLSPALPSTYPCIVCSSTVRGPSCYLLTDLPSTYLLPYFPSFTPPSICQLIHPPLHPPTNHWPTHLSPPLCQPGPPQDRGCARLHGGDDALHARVV